MIEPSRNKRWKHEYEETPTTIEIAIYPSQQSEIGIDRSTVRRGKTVRNLGDLTDYVSLIEGIDRVYPRGDHIVLIIKKNEQAWGVRSILESVFYQIGEFISNGEMLTREITTQLDDFSEEA